MAFGGKAWDCISLSCPFEILQEGVLACIVPNLSPESPLLTIKTFTMGMRNFILTFASLLFLLNTGLSAQSLNATEPDTLADRVLDEVGITATKVPTPLRESAKPTKIISRETIEENPGKDLGQLLNEQANILVNSSYSNPGLNRNLYLRGAAAGYTLVLIDGQPLNDPSGFGGAYDIRLLPTEMIERIEILNGSQSTLYGTDAIAGVINIITREGAAEGFRSDVKLAYGSLNTFNGSAAVSGTIGKNSYRVSYQRNTTSGMSEAEDPEDTGEFDDDGFDQQAVQFNWEYKPTESLSIKPFFRFSDFDGDYDAGAFSDAPNTYESRLFNPGVNAQWKTEKANLTANYSFNATDRLFNSTFGENEFKGRFHHADLFGAYELSEGIKLLGGANLQDMTMLSETTTVTDPNIRIFSPYATLMAQPAEGLSLELGYRLNNHSRYGNNSTYSLAASYLINDQVRLFSSYSTGFRAPVLSELFGQFGANEDLKPEESQTFDIGFQTWLFGDALSLQFSYFNRSIEQIIAYDFTLGYLNQDQQDDQGLEVEATWNVLPSLSFNGFYAYLDGEVTTPDAAEFNLFRRPKHRFGLSANISPINNLTVLLQWQHLRDRTDIFFNNETFASEEVRLSPYMLLNASVNYELPKQGLTLFADLKNITDVEFTEIYGFNALGFNILSGVRLRL